MKIKLTLCTMLVLLVIGCAEEAPPISNDYVRPAKLFIVQGHSGRDVREFPGQVSAAELTTLSFRIAGEITELPVLDGKQVKQGQVIARLDASVAQNELKNAQAEFELSDSEHVRKKSLFDQGIISRSSYDRAYANFVSARANLDIARDNLGYTVIKAPFTGLVGKVSVENHQVVQAKQTIATIQGEKVIEVTIQIPESIMANVRPEAEINDYKPLATFASMPDRSYEVTFKENAAEANGGSQTYDVTFVLDKPDDLTLLPGMSATVTIDIAQISRITDDERYTVPLAAVGRVDGEDDTFVWVAASDTNVIKKIPVTLGRVTDEGVEVLSGIKDGDRLVVAGLSELVDGMTVKPLRLERGI